MRRGYRLRCHYCRRPFTAFRPHAKFCSPSCKSKSRRTLRPAFYEFVCKGCHEPHRALSPKAERCAECARVQHREAAKLYQRARRARERAARAAGLAQKGTAA